jgi:hypothetical protein
VRVVVFVAVFVEVLREVDSFVEVVAFSTVEVTALVEVVALTEVPIIMVGGLEVVAIVAPTALLVEFVAWTAKERLRARVKKSNLMLNVGQGRNRVGIRWRIESKKDFSAGRGN